MRSLKMSWFLILFFLSFTFNNLSESRPEKKLPSAVVVGTVYCDTCFQQDFSKTSHFISGASVAVECKDGDSKPSFREEVKTDKHGEFRVHLPFSVSKHVKKIKGCSVKLISSSEPYCAVASTATSSSLHLKSRKQGTHIFSAGFFTFKPLKQPNLCNQKPSLQNSKELNTKMIANRTMLDLPPLPPLPTLPPSPVLPPLPPLPELPNLPPMPGKTTQSNLDEVSKKAQLSDQKESSMIANATIFPPIQDPTMLDLPPLPTLPTLPKLPPLPPLPKLPSLPPLPELPNLPPLPGKTTQSKPDEVLKKAQLSDQKVAHPKLFFPTPPVSLPPPILHPIPFLPPPILPPNPLQPSPLLPPNPLLPPPAPLIPFPPIPGLTPSRPPSFPFPVPPFPFPPSPRIPGIPPASSSSKKAYP